MSPLIPSIVYTSGQLRKAALEELAEFVYNEMSDLEIYRDGRHRHYSDHSNVYQTDDPTEIEEVKQIIEEESKIGLKIVESMNIDTKPQKKAKHVLKEDPVICINKKEALG